MKKYLLKIKNGEIINTIKSTSLENAINYFKTIKKLNENDLKDIFHVELENELR